MVDLGPDTRKFTGPVTDTVGFWNKRFEWSEDYKQKFQTQWAANWKWYMAKRKGMTDPADWWRSNETIPECFKIIETQLPRDVSGMFSEEEWFRIAGRERSDAEYERIVQSLLMYWVDRSDFFIKAIEVAKYKLIMGHAWGKVTWREETEKRTVEQTIPFTDEFTGQQSAQLQQIDITEEVYNDPDFDWVTLDKLNPDPSGRNLFFIETIRTTMEELQETNDELHIYKNLGEVAISGSTSTNDRGYNEPQSTEGFISQDDIDVSRDGKPVTLRQCWGWVPPALRKNDGNAWRLTVIANGRTEIRNDPSPTPNGRPPYFPIKSIPIPKRVYGASILEFVGPLQDQQSRIANMRMDEVLMNIWGQYVYDNNAGITSNQGFLEPGGRLGVDVPTGSSVNNVFTLLPRKPVLPEAYTEESYRQSQAEDVAATFNEIQGKSGGDRKTATEAERNFQQGSARYQLAALWTDQTFKKEVLTRAFKWYQKRLPPGRLMRIVGTDFEVQPDITQIQSPIDITVTSGIQAFNKQLRLQSEQEMIALAGNDAFAPYFKPGPVLKEFLRDRGWKNVEKFIKTDEEVAKERQQALQQQLQIAEAQADAEMRRETTGKVIVEASKPRQISSGSGASSK